MEAPYKMLFLLTTGLKKWEEQIDTIPVELHQGQRLFIKECSQSNTNPPIDLTNLVKVLKKPSREWGIPHLEKLFPPDASLLDAEIGVTIEAEDFLEDIYSTDEYEQSVMKQILLYCRNKNLDNHYRKIRTFLSNPNHSVIPFQKIYELKGKLNDLELDNLFQSCYETIESFDQVRRCPNCGWTLEWKRGHWRCNKESICHTLKDFTDLEYFSITEQKYFRMTSGIQKYVLLPGISESKIAEKLRKKGYKATLYPNIDEYDIEVEGNGDKIKIDVKDYRNPFQLAQYINRKNINELEENVWYVVPDYRVKLYPAYLKLVRKFIQADRSKIITVFSEKQSIKEAVGRLT